MRRLALLLIAAPGALLCAPAVAPAAPAAPPEGAVVTNGPVRAITVGRGRVYFGGGFTRVGSFVGSNMRLDWTSGELKPGFARTNGQVSDIVSDGKGGWYLGGGFDWVEGVRRTNLVHIKPGGGVYREFNARVEGFVSTLVLDGDRLYIGGTLGKVDGRDRNGIAVVDAGSGRLDTDFRYGGNLAVPEMALSGFQSGGARRLYAQGYASFDGPGPVQALDPFTGNVLPEFDFPFDPRKVGALAVRGDTLYVGGGLGHYQGTEFGAAGSLVALDGVSGEHIRSFHPGGGIVGGEQFETSIDDLEFEGNRLVVGGRFNRVGSHPSAGVAILDPSTGAADTSFEAGIGGRVSDVALAEGVIHAAVGEGVVALDSSGSRLPLDLPAVDGPVDALASQGGILYAGGRFELAGASRRKGLAAIDVGSGRVVKGFAPQAGPGTHAQLALAHGRLFVGDYKGIDGPLAALSPSTGRRLSGFDAPKTQPVYDFDIGPDLVYGAVGGGQKVIAFDANTGRRKRSFRVGAPGYVTDLEFVRRHLYLAGNWDTAGGRRAVIRLGSRSGALAGGFDPRANGEVQSLASDGGRLFLAGPFNRVGRAARPGGAAVGFSGGVDRRFRPLGMPRRGAELAVDGGLLYARNTSKNTIKIFRATDGGRMSHPDWSQFTAVGPTPEGAWFGAGIGGGKNVTWFLGFRAFR